RASPRAEVIATADPEQLRASLGLTGGRARALQGVAGVLASGVSLGPGADRALARAALLGCWGIGPWTADYVALRCLGDPNAFPADDLILKRRLAVSSAAEARELAAGWQPWRGYATMLLWTDAVFSTVDSSVR
ncbi:MAG: DNA-3-methyladenine glycosylase family protein, partial [Mycetocola sp.]